MPARTATQFVLFPDLLDRLVVANFDQHHGSLDGGVVLVMAADARLRLTGRLSICPDDRRQSGNVA